ncbi:DNA-binding response regulator [Paenibacillus sp. PCH8]|uniref:response regulator transcription factor n=1 Tax=Paenibacillus sp. PCH8 TaxID=2066524 RepID=UPI000CF956E7|nr:response regulator [Paenibacillus sp. PCH8]PQP81434.1 DNA-binding response regulator [Paenibacillus sp. PCH8]
MLKVLLVDDEMFVRKGMYELIDWQALGMEIAGEAENGLEALKQVEYLQPDVIITDIRMPILDGLELIQAVANLPNLEPVFIIISGYHDFKYAQQAIRYGVHDYILKPIDDEEMTATLQKSAQMICNKRKHILLAEEQVCNIMLEDMIKGQVQKEDEHRYAEVFGINRHSGLLIGLIELHTGLELRKVTLHRVRELLHTLEDDDFNIFVIEEQRGRFAMMLLWKEQPTNRNVEDKIQRMDRVLSEQLNVDFGLYPGTLVSDMANIPRSLTEAEEAARHKYAEHGRVVKYAEVKDKPLYVFNVNQEDVDPVILSLEERDHTACHTMVDDMFKLFQVRRFSPQAVTGSLLRCITGIMAVVHEMGGTDSGLQRLKALAEQSHERWNLRLLKQAFWVALEEAEEYIAELRLEQSKGDITKIKRYIDTHYTENISLKSIAALFYMNPVYLGRLFRKSYSQYFNEYLLNLRIQEAKKLLRQTDLRMYEIAARVGFQNADYFVTQFEKIVKMSPTAYRNFLKENGQRGVL